MQELPDFVPALSHHFKPLTCDGFQFTYVLFHPRIDGGKRSFVGWLFAMVMTRLLRC